MARALHKLNAKQVEKLTKPGRHGDGGGLYLNIMPAPNGGEAKFGARSWIFLYRSRATGKLREKGLGSLSDVPLARAREKAADCRRILDEGKDPIDDGRPAVAVAVPTFGAVAEALIEAKRSEWRNAKHAAQWTATLTTHAASLWSKPVDAIDTEDVLAVLQPIWTKIPETASRVRGRVEAVLDAARARGHLPPDRANPARLRGHLSHLLGKRQKLSRGRHASMPWQDVPAFVKRLRASQSTAARCLEFTILTAARSGEALGARWEEIDTAEKVWRVPAVRMKPGADHNVPLCERALEILDELRDLAETSGGFVFPGQKPRRPLSNMAMDMVLRRMRVDVTVHGFRSSFRTWAGENGFDRQVAEAALSHTLRDKVEAAYLRTSFFDARRKLMDAWSTYLDTEPSAKVIPLRKA